MTSTTDMVIKDVLNYCAAAFAVVVAIVVPFVVPACADDRLWDPFGNHTIELRQCARPASFLSSEKTEIRVRETTARPSRSAGRLRQLKAPDPGRKAKVARCQSDGGRMRDAVMLKFHSGIFPVLAAITKSRISARECQRS